MSAADRGSALRAQPEPAWTPRTYTLSPELVSVAEKGGRHMAAMEALANDIIAGVVETGRRGLAFCGASRGVGVTFIAANVAAAVSQAGVPTLLIDANLHDPGVQRLFVPDGPVPGLADYLRSTDVALAEIVQPEVLSNLSVIFAGGSTEDATDLIAGERFEELINGCLRDYALTIIDTPPANRWADTRRIARLARYAMLVARRNVSFVDDVATLGRELAEDRVAVIGKLMNGA